MMQDDAGRCGVSSVECESDGDVAKAVRDIIVALEIACRQFATPDYVVIPMIRDLYFESIRFRLDLDQSA